MDFSFSRRLSFLASNRIEGVLTAELLHLSGFINFIGDCSLGSDARFISENKHCKWHLYPTASSRTQLNICLYSSDWLEARPALFPGILKYRHVWTVHFIYVYKTAFDFAKYIDRGTSPRSPRTREHGRNGPTQ